MLLHPHFSLVLVPGFVADRCLRATRYLGRVVRKRPVTTIVVLAILIFVVIPGDTFVVLYLYALHEWNAAQQAVKEGRPEEARDRLKVCLTAWPRSVPVHMLAARAARLSGDLADAEAHLNCCLKLQNGATEATEVEFLLMRAQTGEEDEVAQELRFHVDNGYPEAPLILETLARAYMHNLRLREASAYLTKWMEVAPDAAKPYHWRGWVRERMDDTTGALEDYDQALKRDPGLYAVRLRVAELLLEQFKALDALPYLESLSRDFPDNPEVMARLGHCLLLQGRGDEARGLLEAAVKQLPDDLPLLSDLAKLEQQDGQLAQSEAWLRHALKVDPSDTDALYTLYIVLNLSPSRRKEAAAVHEQWSEKTDLLRRVNQLLQQEAKRPSNNPDVLSELGSLLLRVEREKIGLYWLEQQALRLDPDHQPTHKVLADYYQSKGDRDKAAAHRYRLSAPDKALPKKE